MVNSLSRARDATGRERDVHIACHALHAPAGWRVLCVMHETRTRTDVEFEFARGGVVDANDRLVRVDVRPQPRVKHGACVAHHRARLVLLPGQVFCRQKWQEGCLNGNDVHGLIGQGAVVLPPRVPYFHPELLPRRQRVLAPGVFKNVLEVPHALLRQHHVLWHPDPVTPVGAVAGCRV